MGGCGCVGACVCACVCVCVCVHVCVCLLVISKVPKLQIPLLLLGLFDTSPPCALPLLPSVKA